ncbi:transglycosylase domain-containing protein [Paenibacillus protaetiae]|uniref:PBP1A family penicillin-binding protein n=1 Tax=Paenibacillus protaetiae TaxID=2509456 RepID=A0A4P6EWG2_9BACL|nr:PBP1A family penicillin-binding protein [Paenibacillus protaetiae]QAY67364.1 PBP1A family penicillin-binding protein [Paenibacillus protaetiae]
MNKKPKWPKLRRAYRFPLMAEHLLPQLYRLKKWSIRASVLLVAVMAAFAGLLLFLKLQSLPAASISQTSQMLDLQGQVIDSFHSAENRRSVELSAVSPYVVQATLAIEDKRFYDHNGFDMKGLARAILVDLKSGAATQGASTLTQQLARNLYLSHEKTWQRKLKEAMYTVQLEMNYSKDEIMGMYLNQIYYGHGSYGIEAASDMYFGKHASELTLAESAMLAGIPKGPKYYSPYFDMKNAKDRQRTILNAMAEQGDITKAQADAAYAELLRFKPLHQDSQDGFAPYFRDYVRNYAVEKLGIDENLLNEGGLRIYTTLDYDIQKAAEEAVLNGIPGNSEQQAALVAIDPRNGYIKAMVGGRNYTANQYNRALASTRQPGSSFKPVLYLTALQQQGITPLTRIKSEPTTFTYDEGRSTYEPSNYNDKYANDLIDMREAISSSDNIYAVSTLMNVGADKVIETARKLGMTSPMQAVPSLALGTFPVSPFEMASAFAVFANGGQRYEPAAILRIEDRDGHILYEAKHQDPVQAVDAAHAYVLTNLMQSVFEEGGTGSRVAGLIHRPVAGKTGTTATDAWLVGYTPELATAVWVGYDKNRKLSVAEAHRAAPIFARFTEQALANVPPKMFPMPEGVIYTYVDPASGKLAAEDCPNRRLEAFVQGTEPTEVCGSASSSGTGDSGTDEARESQKRTWWNQLKNWWSR